MVGRRETLFLGPVVDIRGRGAVGRVPCEGLRIFLGGWLLLGGSVLERWAGLGSSEFLSTSLGRSICCGWRLLLGSC